MTLGLRTTLSEFALNCQRGLWCGFFALSWQVVERVGKQRIKPPCCHELAIVCTQGRHFKRAPLI